ncbi:hypothetical protein, partial [Porphyrobacter sp. AAP82]|uniref:hypothetical protein n=1 Tax=Porphyrobacter sp. AAP82 TaxID=1248917 RepID=UPI000475E9C7
MTQNWPAQSSELWPIEKITPYARNSRTHSDEQVAQIAASIREWGWTNRLHHQHPDLTTWKTRQSATPS